MFYRKLCIIRISANTWSSSNYDPICSPQSNVHTWVVLIKDMKGGGKIRQKNLRLDCTFLVLEENMNTSTSLKNSTLTWIRVRIRCTPRCSCIIFVPVTTFFLLFRRSCVCVSCSLHHMFKLYFLLFKSYYSNISYSECIPWEVFSQVI